MTMNDMLSRAAGNLAKTAGQWNDAMRTGDNGAARRLNDAYIEKSALLRLMGFSVVTDTDEDGYAAAVTVDCPGDLDAKRERVEVRGLYA